MATKTDRDGTSGDDSNRTGELRSTGVDGTGTGAARMVGPLSGVVRLLLGWVFMWAFIDKLFGLGFATCRLEDGTVNTLCDSAFLKGGSPTWGYLANATQGSETGRLFDWMAPAGPAAPNLVDWLFMAALLLIGIGLLLGIAMWLSSISGALLLTFMYLSGFVWPENNPFIDDHIVYALVLLLLAAMGAGRYLGFGRWWQGLDMVQRHAILR